MSQVPPPTDEKRALDATLDAVDAFRRGGARVPYPSPKCPAGEFRRVNPPTLVAPKRSVKKAMKGWGKGARREEEEEEEEEEERGRRRRCGGAGRSEGSEGPAGRRGWVTLARGR